MMKSPGATGHTILHAFALLLVLFAFLATAKAQNGNADKDYTVLSRIDEGGSVVATVRRNGVLYLLYDQTIIGAEFDDPYLRKQAAYPGFAIMQCSAYMDRKIHKALQIGLGIGTVPSFLREQGIPTDVVEISASVVQHAAEFFQYEWCEEGDPEPCTNGETFVTDGLAFLENSPADPIYDLLIIDVYTGWNPVVFFLREVIDNIHTNWLIAGKGVLVMNFVGFANGPHATVPRSIYKTLQSIFKHVKCFREMEDPDFNEGANLVFYASDEPFSFSPPTDGHYHNPTPNTYFYGVVNFPKWEIFTDLQEAVEVEIHQAMGAEEVTFTTSPSPSETEGAARERILTKKDHGQKDFANIHTITQTHMRDRVIAQFPDSLWEELKPSQKAAS